MNKIKEDIRILEQLLNEIKWIERDKKGEVGIGAKKEDLVKRAKLARERLKDIKFRKYLSKYKIKI